MGEQGGWGSSVVRQGVWIGVATGLYGISFGALAVASGLTAWQALALHPLVDSVNVARDVLDQAIRTNPLVAAAFD